MKAVVFHGIGDIRLDDVPEPRIEQPGDAIVRMTASAICGTDLHMIRGTMTGMHAGTILGHEGVGIVEEMGRDVRNIREGDRVVAASTIACGYCAYCRSGYFAQCDNSNPNGARAATAFFGGPRHTGPFNGLQAEKARVPFSNVGLVKLPEEVTDDQAILLSDIFPTGYFGADLAEIKPGNTVAVFGCGPVGQFAIISAFLKGAGRVIAVDKIVSRLEMARAHGAEAVNFEAEDPVEAILALTGGIGVDRVIDAVGVDAEMPAKGPAAKITEKQKEQFRRELKQIAPEADLKRPSWRPGDAPSQALMWAVDSVAKAGTLSIIGVYPETVQSFPIGKAMNKNLTIQGGNCNHRKYIPMLIELVKSGAVNPEEVLSNVTPFASVLDAYRAFDERQPGWMKVELVPSEELVGA
ncbi:MAG: glutathione-dependent formaldehyde dehydrogenase [Nitrospiraceae bacterium]|nr:glutathione-dependent formaldehyde dehydrogenase [Nitrospiraceae bacterium]